MTRLLTVGHGPLRRDALRGLLVGAGVQTVVDVRRFPGSRRNPDVSQDVLAGWLGDAGVGYHWAEDLGGRRRLPADEEPLDTWWTVAAFRAYAAHTRAPEFVAALTAVLEESRTRSVTVMCSESVWWRCHRRLIADVATVAHGVDVQHLMHDGKLRPHRPADGARVRDDGLMVWDADR
ncbi:MAG TPA: DUF488 domain-containing protein [Nocardioidaceae bacterium]|nr:DUF488 domain-containing protein [Nocardioidaceae bacterium]